jgi:hypothetical protein
MRKRDIVKLQKQQSMYNLQKARDKIKRIATSPRAQMLAIMACFGSAMCFAQNTAGDYSAGITALTTVATEIAKYIPIVVKLCYAIAGVVAVIGAISVYISMNNEEQDVKNILVFSNCRDYIRKQIEDKTLSINLLGRIFNFQIFA